MDRKRFLIIFGVVELALFIYLIVSYERGLGTLSFVIGFFLLAAIALVGVVVAFYRYPWVEEKKEGGFDPGLIEVSRTREGTIFEALTGLILAGAWAVVFATHLKDGVDRHAISLFVLTVIDITILCDVYSPGIKSRMRKYTNAKQVALDIRMCRFLAVEFALFILSLAIPAEHYQRWWLYIIVAAFLITFAIFRYLIHKAR